MEHVMFIQKIKSEKHQQYIETHKNVWPKLIEAIQESGIKREIIWINDDYIYLYMMAINFDVSIKKLTNTQIFKDWLSEITPLLDEVQEYSKEGKIQKLKKVFYFEGQSKT